MGTNFYLKSTPKESEDDDDPTYHVGKRSAAGLYCWDCRQTLEGGGDEVQVHGNGPRLPACPKCGKAHHERPFDAPGYNPVKIELGFQKAGEEPLPTGVDGCSSFTWAMPREEAEGHDLVDEYGREYSWVEFEAKVLRYCPIQLFHAIGRAFS